MTLAIGVITTSMEEANDEQEEKKELEKKVETTALRFNLEKSAVEMYRMCFDLLDVRCGGSIDEDELRGGLAQINKHPTDDEMRTMFSAVDAENNGEINFAEFLQLMATLKNLDAATVARKDSHEPYSINDSQAQSRERRS